MITDDGFAALVAAMIRYTGQDYRQGQYWDKKSAQHFLTTNWFTDICEGVRLEPSKVTYLICNCPVRRRKYYE